MLETLTLDDNQASLDISLVQGDSREIVLEFNDDAVNPISLAGYGVKLIARTQPSNDATVLLEKSNGSGINVDGNAITIFFGAELSPIQASVAYYDILFSNGNNHRRFVAGQLFIKSSVTV